LRLPTIAKPKEEEWAVDPAVEEVTEEELVVVEGLEVQVVIADQRISAPADLVDLVGLVDHTSTEVGVADLPLRWAWEWVVPQLEEDTAGDQEDRMDIHPFHHRWEGQ
jgi:hypothetical protein